MHVHTGAYRISIAGYQISIRPRRIHSIRLSTKTGYPANLLSGPSLVQWFRCGVSSSRVWLKTGLINVFSNILILTQAIFDGVGSDIRPLSIIRQDNKFSIWPHINYTAYIFDQISVIRPDIQSTHNVFYI